jgi:hypothetical protein
LFLFSPSPFSETTTLTPLSPSPAHSQGKRALSFVLKNQGMIDKTLMFDIELLKLNRVGRAGV